jgi:drug/metabolite transporter (DMT)-like permease
VTKKENTKIKAPLGASLVVLSSFFYASYGIWTKLMGNFFDGYTASALRSVLVLIILVPIAVSYHKLGSLHLKQNWHHIAGMLAASLFTWGPLYYAILRAGVGISLAVTYASIVLGMFFFGWLFANERFTKDKAVSAALGIAGLALIFLPTTKGIGWLALVAALVSGLSSAANSVFAKCIHYNATQSTVVLWVTSVIANMLMAVVFSKPYPAIGWHIQWFYLVIFAAASVIASWSFVRGVKLIDAGAAGVLGLFEIVFGVAFGLVLFHERPSLIALTGVVVIIAAAAIPYFQHYRIQEIRLTGRSRRRNSLPE